MSDRDTDEVAVPHKDPGTLGEVLDITSFQHRLARIRARNQQVFETSPTEWARRVTDIQDEIRTRRAQLEAALLEQTMGEEHAMLDRLVDIERNLRNMIRLYRQLMDERNSMCAGLSSLHRWIRELEIKQGRAAHPDHGVDLSQKSFVEYLSKQAWIFDNHQGWDLEETPRRRRSSTARD